MINLLHIGLGAWGPGLARNLAKVKGAKLVSLCDRQEGTYEKVSSQFPGIQFSKNYEEFLTDGQIDAVSIATPAHTHFRIAKEFLEKGKHVLVEKPLAMTVQESHELVTIARGRNLTLMVGHV
ncbi:MAG: Gfo/Idh/MocA family oxidoreductase, partial [Syntrophales bacterium LBB04]|nr:Gfo/Idh/MocA family oxidoreductase [Syntrophales bacterium LBB04]